MYSSLQLGSVSLPTGPLSSLLAVWLAIEIAARMGKRFGVSYDDLFGMCMAALATGILTARLWHVFSFWGVYQTNLLDILSLRPTGLSTVPGLVCACLGAYGFLIVRKLDPTVAAAATLTGLVAGSTLFFMGSFLSGRVIGTVSDMPWAVPYGDMLRHPAGLYQALGCALIWMLLWYRSMDKHQVLLIGLFFCSLLFLFTDTFIVYKTANSLLRWPQAGYLVIAVTSALGLARRAARLAARLAVPDTPAPPTTQAANTLSADTS